MPLAEVEARSSERNQFDHRRPGPYQAEASRDYVWGSFLQPDAPQREELVACAHGTAAEASGQEFAVDPSLLPVRTDSLQIIVNSEVSLCTSADRKSYSANLFSAESGPTSLFCARARSYP